MPFLMLLPLLLLLSLLTREGWKVLIALGIGFVVVMAIVLLARRLPNRGDERLRQAGSQNEVIRAVSQEVGGDFKVED